MAKEENKDLAYWKANAEEDYMKVPISVLRYISELEAVVKNNAVKFKQGEWCFCEFALQQVMETEENRITGVSDGMFRLSGHDLSDRCYPLEMKVKQISDIVAFWSKEFHALKK